MKCTTAFSAFSIAIALAIAVSGCAKKAEAPVGASAAPEMTASVETTSSPQTQSEQSPSQSQTLAETSATLAGVVNVLSNSEGTILRSWPASSFDTHPISLLYGEPYYWKSKEGASGPYEFVFELPGPATIQQFGFVSGDDPAINAHTVHVAVSTESAGSGFSEVGTYDLKDGTDEQTFSIAKPAKARWVRLTIESRGATTLLSAVRALGTFDDRPPAKPIAGTWKYFEADPFRSADGTSDAPASFPKAPDIRHMTLSERIMEVHQTGDEISAAVCSPQIIVFSLHGHESGSRVLWDVSTEVPFSPAIINAESTLIVDSGQGGTYVAARINGGSCATALAPKGQGKPVLLLVDKVPETYAPYANTDKFPGYRFVPLGLTLLDPRTLAGFDTAVLSEVCKAGALMTRAQTQTLMDWVYTGHKLIVNDSDVCTSNDYSFVPYAFTTSNPGAHAAHGDHLVLVESNTLGSDNTDPRHFVDLPAYIAAANNQLGDANVVTTEDHHWCGHFFGTNMLHQNGYMQMFAPFGQGMLIYNGLDHDDQDIVQYDQILRFELEQRPDAQLPCTQLVATKFSVAPSDERTFTPGSPQTEVFHLAVLASHGYSGKVQLTARHPPDAAWITSLSTTEVSLNGDTVPLDFTITVPQDAKPGSYAFVVEGTDTNQATASATLTLTSLKRNALMIRAVPVQKNQRIAKTLATKRRVAVYGIHFDFASATLRPESAPVLKEIADSLSANPSWKLIIEGHTDNVGGVDYNLDLSRRRAAAVKEALTAHYHIRADRLTTVGYGFSHPKASNDSAEGRALNRRVELVRR